MASLMEELVNVLEAEKTEYASLLELSLKKTPVLISADLEELGRITDAEQEITSRIVNLDRKREVLTKDMANVLNKSVEDIKLSNLIEMMSGRPQEQKRLAVLYDELSDVIAQMKRANEQNKVLIESSLEMVQFDITILQSMKAAPETANYNRNAYNTGNIMGSSQRGFDSKS